MLFDHIKQNSYLKLINHNKTLQKKLNISINDFIDYYNKIIIEVIPDLINNEIYQGKFFYPQEDKLLYNIYLDNDVKIDRNFLTKDDKVTKIRIEIDSKVKNLESLFEKCKGLKQIQFIKFNRKDVTKIKRMFLDCKSLINLDISKLITDNVTNMAGMFCGCSNLKELNVSNFKTNNVTDMRIMFHGCKSLKELNVSNFITDNV